MPVVGALVTVSRPDGPPAQTHTCQAGKFRVRPVHKWYVLYACYRCKCVYGTSSAALTIQREGYQTYTSRIGPGIEEFAAGDIELRSVGTTVPDGVKYETTVEEK